MYLLIQTQFLAATILMIEDTKHIFDVLSSALLSALSKHSNMVRIINMSITWSKKRLSSGAISLLEKNCSKNGQSGRLYLHILILSNDHDYDNDDEDDYDEDDDDNGDGDDDACGDYDHHVHGCLNCNHNHI